MKTTAPPAATNRRTWASSSRARLASSDEVGSSRMTSRGGAPMSRKAMAISTICRCGDARARRARRRRRCRGPGRSRRASPRPPRRRGRASPSRRAPAREHPHVLGDRQVRAERELLEDAAQAGGARARDAVAGRLVAVDEHGPPASGASAAVQHVDQRRLAGAVVADQADALAGADREVHAGERAHGAEGSWRPRPPR